MGEIQTDILKRNQSKRKERLSQIFRFDVLTCMRTPINENNYLFLYGLRNWLLRQKCQFLNMKKVAKFHQNNQYTKLSHSDVKEACSSSS